MVDGWESFCIMIFFACWMIFFSFMLIEVFRCIFCDFIKSGPLKLWGKRIPANHRTDGKRWTSAFGCWNMQPGLESVLPLGECVARDTWYLWKSQALELEGLIARWKSDGALDKRQWFPTIPPTETCGKPTLNKCSTTFQVNTPAAPGVFTLNVHGVMHACTHKLHISFVGPMCCVVLNAWWHQSLYLEFRIWCSTKSSISAGYVCMCLLLFCKYWMVLNAFML